LFAVECGSARFLPARHRFGKSVGDGIGLDPSN
jgi:hypothetical protein